MLTQPASSVAAQERCECWDVPDSDGDTPVMKALKEGKTEIVKILLRCPYVKLTCRDKQGLSLVIRAIAEKKTGKYLKLLILT